MTLCGQPSAYWSGSYSQALEDNPLAARLLTTHPAAFLVGCLAWLLCVLSGILVLPRRAARIVALAVLLGHAIGTSTWLLRLRFGAVWVVLLLLVARWVADKLIWPDSPEGSIHGKPPS